MTDQVLARYADLARWWTLPPVTPRAVGERGEGVISAALAVLIMAGIGALVWVGFKACWEDPEGTTSDTGAELGE